MNDKIIIDLASFKGRTPRDLKAHIEQVISNVKCVVKVPSPDSQGRLAEFRLTGAIDLNVSDKEYFLEDVVNENYS